MDDILSNNQKNTFFLRLSRFYKSYDLEKLFLVLEVSCGIIMESYKFLKMLRNGTGVIDTGY